MNEVRKIKDIFASRSTMEGAGVRLMRVFSHGRTTEMDPFLLLDNFGSDNPNDYLKGFPWHPHRGIETITYMIEGNVKHEDSLGNSGTIGSGDVQWMTAGSGIIHQEMPDRFEGLMMGFQLWANLPMKDKMMHPRYRDIKKEDIKEVTIDDKVKVKIIAGEINGTKGPVEDIAIDPEYFDITIEPHGKFEHPTKHDHTVFAFIFEGEGYFDSKQKEAIKKNHCVLFAKGDKVTIHTKSKRIRFLLISGKPLKEPIAWYGPIVMNTNKELQIARQELNDGTFIKHKQ